MSRCKECDSERSRITPVLKPLNCLEKHTQYKCGTCGRYICIQQDGLHGLRRWNFPFKTLEIAKVYLRVADYCMKQCCGIYEITQHDGRISYKIFASKEDLTKFLSNNKDKQYDKGTPIFQHDKFLEYPNTEIKKLSEEEVRKYMDEQACEIALHKK